MFARPISAFGFVRAAPAALTPNQFDLVEIDDDEDSYRPLWMRHPQPLARVGAESARLVSGDDVAAYGSQTDDRYKRTDSAVASWLVKKYGSTVVDKVGPGFTGQASMMTPDDAGFVSGWKAQYRSWAIFWGNTLSSAQLPIEAGYTHDAIAAFDHAVREWQTRLNARGGGVYIDPAAPGAATSWWDGISTLVWVLGIGLIIFVGLAYIAPALIGAAATTRGSYRTLRSA